MFVSAVLMVYFAVQNNMEKPYANYVLPLGKEGRSQGCETPLSPANYSLVYDEYFKYKSADLHFGEPDTSYAARLSPYTYASIGRYSIKACWIKVVLGTV